MMPLTPSSTAFSSTNEKRSPLGSAWASTSLQRRLPLRLGARENERAAPIAPELLDPDPVLGARAVGRRELVARPEPQHRPQVPQPLALEQQAAVAKASGGAKMRRGSAMDAAPAAARPARAGEAPRRRCAWRRRPEPRRAGAG